MVAAGVWNLNCGQNPSKCTPLVFPRAVSNGETQETGKWFGLIVRGGKAETLLMSQGGAIKAAHSGRGEQR